ncbi:uncharacterized protein LOC113790088 isoform X2 [Dermatophagoides pteronyssinus]|uniref:uncharacterized protein LOC113790088 isoform X2 n=1 Tax=Dermatophagoides pteronyssinus TaxID=6956 RepID=UPI003F66195D
MFFLAIFGTIFEQNKTKTKFHRSRDHIAEVLRKWEQIDDEIWAKMIFMSRNRRIAKAYVRVPAVIIDGTDNGFDGYRVGLNGFEDPFRDSMTDQLMNSIEKGCRIGIDDNGNILIKRYSMSNVFVRSYPLDYSHSCVDNNIKRMNGCLELQKKYLLFDMSKFEMAMMNELKSAYPDRYRLEQQCIIIIGFVRDHPDSILDMPCYVMLINIVALDMLKSKLNPVMYRNIVQKKRPVPEFVSIFQQYDDGSDNDINDDDDDDDNHYPIYGKINESSYGDNYSWKNNNNNNNRFTGDNNRRNNRLLYSHENGPHSMPTLINIHPPMLPSRQSEMSINTINTNKPPKLPPRDKKKLSRQINTIKSARKNQKNHNNLTIGRSVEIPSPDYHHNNDEILSTTNTTNNTIKSRSNRTNTKRLINDNDDVDENIYGTIMLNNNRNGHHHHQREQNGRINHNNNHYYNKNWPISTTINDRYERSMTKSMPTYYHSNNNNNGRTVTGPSSFHHLSTNSTSINRTFRGDGPNLLMNINRLDEDPYYSGLEARVTSNRLHNTNHRHHQNNSNNNNNNDDDDVNVANVTKTKGLNWMMRKVLSSNYINILTSRRQKKQNNNINTKIPKSKSSTNESSTDSDPYVSINDVYEPIYGYGINNNNNNNNSRMSNGWPTIQARIKP